MRAWSRAIEAKPDSRALDSLFTFVLIKPTHYDDDGYPIQWFRSVMPSNTLACMFSLAEDARKREVLGPGVGIDVETYDETNRRVVPSRIIRDLEQKGGRTLIGVVGAQSNQYPRSIDLAREFRAAGLQVCVGGFHVSGCIAMLPEMPEELKAAQAMGVSLFAGEAEEHRLDEVLLDAWRGELKPLYNFMDHLPSLEGEPAPILPRKHVVRTSGKYSSIDLGRGCPYQCSFCTIINVQGRKSRFRTPDDLEQIIRANKAQGIDRFFITDDNFARNSDWEILLDRVIALKQEGIHVGFTIQVDTLCHKIPNFIEKATEAGVRRVFIGLENINPENLIAAKKRQNKITEYRVMLQKWRAHGAITYAGYILGFPADTKESILRDIEIIKRELPLDILEFFFLTPLPGSEDHKKLSPRASGWTPTSTSTTSITASRITRRCPMRNGRRLTGRHGRLFIRPSISARSCGAPRQIPNGRPKPILSTIGWFKLMTDYEGVHPLEGGAFRLKYRRDRRHGLQLESPLVFYPRYGYGIVTKAWNYFRFFLRTRRILKEVLEAPDRSTYTDLAIAPPQDDEFEQLSLYHATSGGEAALARKALGDSIRELARPAAVAMSATPAQ